jgi:ethanolamine utilization protein EutN
MIMLLARVIGRATATERHDSLAGQRLLVGRSLDASLQPSGDPQLMLDQLGAGAGDVVIISSDGKGLREMLGRDDSPARWYTIGIVDALDAPGVGGKERG